MDDGVGWGAMWVGAFVGVVVGDCVGVSYVRHNRAPACSRSPCKILVPCLLQTSSLCLLIYAVQLASQSLPRLSRLLVKPGIMWPVHAACGMVGMVRAGVPVNVFASLVAVRIVVVGASVLMFRSGAV